MSSNSKTVEFPLYATQGGGLACYKDGVLVWHTPPDDFPEFKVGDDVPEMWGIVPANAAARESFF